MSKIELFAYFGGYVENEPLIHYENRLPGGGVRKGLFTQVCFLATLWFGIDSRVYYCNVHVVLFSLSQSQFLKRKISPI